MFPLPPETEREVSELAKRVRELHPRAQLDLLTRIARNMNRDHFPPMPEEQAALDKTGDEFDAAFLATNGFDDPPYPVPPEVLAEQPGSESLPLEASCGAAKSIS